MPSTFSDLKIELMATGEKNTTWGDITNENLGTAIEEAICGTSGVTFADNDQTLTLLDTNSEQVARNFRIVCVGSTGGVTRNLILGAGCQIEKQYIIQNNCLDPIVVKNPTGLGTTVAAGQSAFVYNDGTNVRPAITALAGNALTPTHHLMADANGSIVSSPKVYETDPGGLTVNTNLNVGPTLQTGLGVTAGQFASFELGGSRTGSGGAYIDIITEAGADYNTRLLRSAGTDGAFVIANGGAGYTALSQEGVGPIIFNTTNVERMRIHGGGNVSINTTSDTGEKLGVVNGNIYIPYVAQNVADNRGALLGHTSSDGGLFKGFYLPSYCIKWAIPNDATANVACFYNSYGGHYFVAGGVAQLTVGQGASTVNGTFGVNGHLTATQGAHIVGSADILHLVTNIPRGTGGNYIVFDDPSTRKGYIGYPGPVEDMVFMNEQFSAVRFYTNSQNHLTINPDGTTAARRINSDEGIQLQINHQGGGLRLLYNANSAGSMNWDFVNDVGVYGDFAFRRSVDQAGSTWPYVWYADGVRNFYAYGPTLGLATYGEGKIGLKVGGVSNSGYIEFFETGGGRLGYLGYIPQGGGYLQYTNETGSGHSFSGSGVIPNTAGGSFLGNSAYYWSAVYAANGTIQPSDERMKNWLGAPDEAAIRAAGRIIDELGFYTWANGQDDKAHFGVRAQQVLRILMEEGLEDAQNIDFTPDTFVTQPLTLRHAFVQFDTWEESETTAPPPPSSFPEPPSDDGPREPDPELEPVAHEVVVSPAGNRFSMNLAELGLFVATAQHARMNALEARLTAAGI